MTRALKTHMYKPDYEKGDLRALCGKVSENTTSDPEAVSCNTCSGIYRTNLEWYSQVRNKAVEGKGANGDFDLYTRRDIEAGLMRLGWSRAAVFEILTKTHVFRDVILLSESPDPWTMENKMGVRVSPGGPR